jgi:predicted Zn-dependent peptidase
MKYERSTLGNGLRIITANIRDSFSVATCIFAGVGSRYEDYDKNGGVSHFLEHLLFKGSAKRPTPEAIALEVDGVGGNTNAYTTYDLTNFYMRMPKPQAELSLDILSDMIRNPVFNPEEVDRERGAVIEEMNMRQDDPSLLVHELLPSLLWPNDPLGKPLIGSKNIIKTIPRESIADYQRLHYSPDNLVISAAGDIRHEEMVAMVERFMGDMKPFSAPKLAPLQGELSPQVVNGITSATNQAHIVIGCHAYPYNHPNDPAARVLAYILGVGMSSRLFVNVRGRQGLVYSVFADYDNLVDTGQFSVYAGINLEKVEKAVTSILSELFRLTEEPVLAEELAKVKNKMSGGLQMALENTFAVADRIGTRLLLLDQIKTPEQTLAEIDAVTVEDVQRVATELFAPHKLRLAVIAPDITPAENTFKEMVARKKT